MIIMSSATEEQQNLIEKLQIYPTSKAGVSPFWRGFSIVLSLVLQTVVPLY